MRATYYLIALFFFFLLIITFYQTPLSDEQIQEIQKLFPALTSIVTLIIALTLYDRFGIRKNLFERKVVVVLDLLMHIKSLKVKYSYSNSNPQSNGISYSGGIIEIKKQLFPIHSHQEKIMDAPVLFYLYTVIQEFEALRDYANNPFLPKHISKSLDFIGTSYSKPIDKRYLEIVKVATIGDQANFDIDDWVEIDGKFMSLRSYLKHLIHTITLIEEWLNKNSDYNLDLNI